MLTKFETESSRVVGLSFHPNRPWILTSLHDGTILLWDYRMYTQLDTFAEHTGPVRGICFHNEQPLFVSGSDDQRIKVWNYMQKKCIFTLLGHLDFVRTTFFHHEYPWILSASDDQTIRIWDWQNRTCISVLRGHRGYVMCAQFHPSEDMIISASFDRTIRIWDISGLRNRHIPSGLEGFDQWQNRGSNNCYAQADVVVTHVLIGHDYGVNWASFHPTLPLIVSASDDYGVIMWRLNELKAWEVDPSMGHTNNVSCVLFHPSKNVILSNSEDKTIKVWDMARRTCLNSFEQKDDKFWILAAHPTLNLFAAGHDTGMILFKLERERPAYAVHRNYLYYVKERFLRKFDFRTETDTLMMEMYGDGRNPAYGMSCDQAGKYVLTYTRSLENSHESIYDLSIIPEGGDAFFDPETKSGWGITAIWVAKNRFAVLDAVHSLVIKNLKNVITKRVKKPSCNEIFYAGVGKLLLRDNEKVMLFDVQREETLAEVKISTCRYVIWSNDMSHVALLGQRDVRICNRNLESICMISESSRAKSGVWDDSGVFIYSTNYQLKYVINNGDHGTIQSLDLPIYVTRVEENQIHCLDRECRTRKFEIETTEYKFKLAVINRKYQEILRMVRTENLIGQSMVGYLLEKGYPEIALLLVTDDKTKFRLALECGNIEVALEAARILDEKSCWENLAHAALLQGNHQIVELCYQKTKELEKLGFLYLITGNFKKFTKMVTIPEIREDAANQHERNLCPGDVHERSKILRDSGEHSRAHVTEKNHGIPSEGDDSPIEAVKKERDDLERGAVSLRSRVPVEQVRDNWPLVPVSKGFLEAAMTSHAKRRGAGALALEEDCDVDDELEIDDAEGAVGGEPPAKDEDGAGWEFEDIEIPPAELDTTIAVPQDGCYSAPTQGAATSQDCVENSQFAINHILAGSFESAFRLLNDQVGIIDFEVYQTLFSSASTRARTSYASLPSIPTPHAFRQRNWRDATPKTGLPADGFHLTELVERLQICYELTTEGKFIKAIEKFGTILLTVPLLVVDTRKEIAEAQQLIEICKEYILGLKMELDRKNSPKATLAEQKRICEMAAYLTHFNLQPIHQVLTLKIAMSLCFTLKNYKTAAFFARKLLKLGPRAEIAKQVRKILRVCNKNLVDEHQLAYDENNLFSLCAATYTPIYRGKPEIKCPLCDASYHPQYKDSLCRVCEVSQVGKECIGLRISSLQFR